MKNQKLRFSSFLVSFLFKALALSIFRVEMLFKIVPLA
ncbi:putative membrane protein [Helicobacter pylori NQ4076]|uniref:Putative membrane protein n=1 Tax=Helicobacter pylori NQ4076 TaxID=992029 RepID=J0J8P4_HELPX|nr:putative membrane protein [Helicobacter pylori NQ4076]